MKLHLQIITPEKIAYAAEADSVTLPTSRGEITILPKHITLATTLAHGAMVVRAAGKEVVLAIYKGYAEVNRNQVLIMTSLAERAEEIDAEKAEAARLAAQERLANKLDEATFVDTVADLEKALARIKTTRRRRQRPQV